MQHRPTADRPAGHRPAAVLLRAAATAVLAAGLAGCGPADAQQAALRPATSTRPVPTASPSAAAAPATAAPGAAAPEATGPEVPVRSAALDAVEVAPAAVPPAALAIPSLGIALPVDPVGVEKDGQMEIPPLAERAGWYRYGAAPGAGAGTAVVAAHVDSVASAGLGPFARLPEVQPGAVVDVTLADGTTRQYAVTDVTRQAKPEISWADVFVRDGSHRLVLVTCGGTFQREVGHYSDNVIVTAEPLGGG